MELAKLFEVQKVLRERINYNEPDRFDKLVLALLVELGECANEWRGFKFWSTDQEPRTFKREGCPDCEKKGFRRGNPPTDEKKGVHGLGNHWYDCEKCRGFLVVDKNPLLEEYVDVLHFMLEIGIEIECTEFEFWPVRERNVTDQFVQCFNRISDLQFQMRVNKEIPVEIYEFAWCTFASLGDLLGFTWEEIEKAYYKKNEINHERQNSGY